MTAIIGMRVRFMDLLYAVIIGNAMQRLEPSDPSLHFYFLIFLIVVILEDLFLYYADVAPENNESHGVSFFGMISEISILTVWYFSFYAAADESWIFLVYFALFSYLKVLGGFLNCLVSGDLLTLKFARELLFLAAGAFSTYYFIVGVEGSVSDAHLFMALFAAVWIGQTVLWWLATAVVRRAEGKALVLQVPNG